MNPVKGETALLLKDGTELVLVLDFEALIQAEAAAGKPLARLLAEAKAGFFGAYRCLLFGALRRHHADITMQDAAEIFMQNGDAATEALGRATELAFPAEDKEDKNPPARPRAGKISGDSGAKRGSSRKGSSTPPRARSG